MTGLVCPRCGSPNGYITDEFECAVGVPVKCPDCHNTWCWVKCSPQEIVYTADDVRCLADRVRELEERVERLERILERAGYDVYDP